MIGFLSGQIKSKQLDSLILDVNGVGYVVFLPAFVIKNCQVNSSAKFMIFTYVREDELSLFGFGQETDREIFIQLISVSGIGPRLGMAVLSHAQGADRIIKAIRNANVNFFTQVKGLGKKGAQRIIVDLKSKLGSLEELKFEAEKDDDLVDALKGLGFSKKEIQKATQGIDSNLNLEEKIKQSLKKHE